MVEPLLQLIKCGGIGVVRPLSQPTKKDAKCRLQSCVMKASTLTYNSEPAPDPQSPTLAKGSGWGRLRALHKTTQVPSAQRGRDPEPPPREASRP